MFGLRTRQDVSSVMTPVYIYVDPASIPPLITSNDTVCVGDTLNLNTSSVQMLLMHGAVEWIFFFAAKQFCYAC